MSDILIIHPDEARGQEIADGLAEYGHDIIIALDYAEGSINLQESRFDAVVLDTDLPSDLYKPRGQKSFVSMVRREPRFSRNSNAPFIALGEELGSRDYVESLDTSCGFPDISLIHEAIERVSKT